MVSNNNIIDNLINVHKIQITGPADKIKELRLVNDYIRQALKIHPENIIEAFLEIFIVLPILPFL